MIPIDSLPTPATLQKQYPTSLPQRLFLQNTQQQIRTLLQYPTTKKIAIVGPCSIHDKVSCLEYGKHLAALQQEIEATTLLIFRLFIEKPRSLFGWKGLLYDPLLDGSNRIDLGLAQSRDLLLEMSSLHVPCALELVDPLIFSYFHDLISWGLVGARTSASPIHRQMASGAPFPIGFKNDLQGRFDEAICGIRSARTPHTHLGINAQGQIAAIRTNGNPLTHLVLRGSEPSSNFDSDSVACALQALQQAELEPHLFIDCSHGNSAKQALRQIDAFESILAQWQQGPHSPIKGWMLESHLHPGQQPLSSPLQYGISITDACLGWKETEELLKKSHKMLLSLKDPDAIANSPLEN